MQSKEIIYKALEFLIIEYNMEFKYICNGKEYFYHFCNPNGCFTYYEWPQFEDKEYFVAIINEPKKSINIFENYKELLDQWNKKHSGIKWFFKDKRKDYWGLIASIIKKEISKTGHFFGIKVNKKE